MLSQASACSVVFSLQLTTKKWPKKNLEVGSQFNETAVQRSGWAGPITAASCLVSSRMLSSRESLLHHHPQPLCRLTNARLYSLPSKEIKRDKKVTVAIDHVIVFASTRFHIQTLHVKCSVGAACLHVNNMTILLERKSHPTPFPMWRTAIPQFIQKAFIIIWMALYIMHYFMQANLKGERERVLCTVLK